MLTLQVKGMSCGHCKKAVTSAILAKDSKAQVTVDVQSGRVEVDSTLSDTELKEAIDDAGYELISVKR